MKFENTESIRNPKRKTCKRQEKTDEVMSESRRNKFDVLNLTECGLEVEGGERS